MKTAAGPLIQPKPQPAPSPAWQQYLNQYMQMSRLPAMPRPAPSLGQRAVDAYVVGQNPPRPPAPAQPQPPGAPMNKMNVHLTKRSDNAGYGSLWNNPYLMAGGVGAGLGGLIGAARAPEGKRLGGALRGGAVGAGAGLAGTAGAALGGLTGVGLGGAAGVGLGSYLGGDTGALGGGVGGAFLGGLGGMATGAGLGAYVGGHGVNGIIGGDPDEERAKQMEQLAQLAARLRDREDQSQ